MDAPGFLVVASARAGSTKQEAIDAAAAVLARSGPTEVVATSAPEELDGVLDRGDGRAVVVAGGDGSLHVVVQRLWERGQLDGTILGLVPLGTGNDFARGLGLPLAPVEAARALSRGRPRRLDLLVDDDGGVAVNVVHAGVGADAAEDAKALKGRIGPLAYPVGALIAAVRDKGWQLEVTLDGSSIGGDAELMVGVGNGKTIGGGTPLCPLASPDDGLLDVVVVNATGPAARAAFAVALRRGDHLDRPDVHFARGHEVCIRGDPVCHNVDGEVSDELSSRTYRVEPAAWSLLLP